MDPPPPTTDRLVSLVFRVWSRFYDHPWLQKPYYRRVHNALLSLLEDGPAPARVLDLGCGTGQLATDLADRYPDATVIGADLSADMLAVANGRAADGFELANASVYALPFASGSFELVTNTISYHWYLDYPRALAEIRRVLRPGGRLVMATISSPVLRSPVIRRPWELLTADRTRVAEPGQIRDELGAAGFEVDQPTALFPLVRLFVARRG